MPSPAEIQRQIEACPNHYIFWTQKEIRALPEILDENETIKALTSGMVDGSTWLAVCTDRRLIFLNCGMLYGVQQIQMPLDRVQSIDHQFTFFFGTISVFDGVNVFSMRMVLKSSILPFVRATQEMMYAERHSQPQSAPAPAADVAGQLAKLAELREKGYLTDAEFQSQKKKLLG